MYPLVTVDTAFTRESRRGGSTATTGKIYKKNFHGFFNCFVSVFFTTSERGVQYVRK